MRIQQVVFQQSDLQKKMFIDIDYLKAPKIVFLWKAMNHR